MTAGRVQRGDWLRPVARFGKPNSPSPKFYLLPPSQRAPESLLPRDAVGELDANTSYFGPVHDVETFWPVVSCLVPHPHPAGDGLVWINVGSWISGHWQSFCRVVPRSDVESWRRRGWVDRYRAMALEGEATRPLVATTPVASSTPQAAEPQPAHLPRLLPASGHRPAVVRVLPATPSGAARRH